MYYRILTKVSSATGGLKEYFIVEESLYSSFIGKTSKWFNSLEEAQSYIDTNKKNRIGVVQ